MPVSVEVTHILSYLTLSTPTHSNPIRCIYIDQLYIHIYNIFIGASEEELSQASPHTTIVLAFLTPLSARDRSTMLLSTILGLLPFLARRYEFDLLHLISPRATSQFYNGFMSPAEQLEVTRRYQTSLMRTTLLVAALARETQTIRPRTDQSNGGLSWRHRINLPPCNDPSLSFCVSCLNPLSHTHSLF